MGKGRSLRRRESINLGNQSWMRMGIRLLKLLSLRRRKNRFVFFLSTFFLGLVLQRLTFLLNQAAAGPSSQVPNQPSNAQQQPRFVAYTPPVANTNGHAARPRASLPAPGEPPLDYNQLLALVKSEPAIVNQLPKEYQIHFAKLLGIPLPTGEVGGGSAVKQTKPKPKSEGRKSSTSGTPSQPTPTNGQPHLAPTTIQPHHTLTSSQPHPTPVQANPSSAQPQPIQFQPQPIEAQPLPIHSRAQPIHTQPTQLHPILAPEPQLFTPQHQTLAPQPQSQVLAPRPSPQTQIQPQSHPAEVTTNEASNGTPQNPSQPPSSWISAPPLTEETIPKPSSVAPLPQPAPVVVNRSIDAPAPSLE